MKQIEIDLDVHRAIENGRTSFEEHENDILRRLLGIDSKRLGEPNRPRLRQPRSSGAYSVMIGKDPIEANSLKELLRRVILKGEKIRAGFIADLARVPTARGRHIVAISPEALYPKSPQLLEYAEKLNGEWWYDTNVGRYQVLSYLKIIAGMLNLPSLPAISKRSEKSTLDLGDLGLD
jgi:hypothetical protein